MAIEATGEHLDATAAEPATAIPVISCDGIQPMAQDAVIDVHVLGVGGIGEKPMEAVVRVQMAGRGERDRDDAAPWLHIECFEIDYRILPNLRVDQIFKCASERTLPQTGDRQHATAMH